MDKVTIWNDILHFSETILFIYSFNLIQFYIYGLNKRNQRKYYLPVPSMSRLVMILFYMGIIIYLTQIAYNQFCLISRNSLLFIPVAIIPLTAIIFFPVSFFARILSRSMDIYFFRQDAVGAMIQNVLNNMGWRDIQVSKSIQGQTAITEPDKKFWIQVRSNQIMNTVTIQPIDKNLKLKTVTQNFKKLLLRELIKSTYMIDPGMVLLFKKKYLWQYILSWFSLCLCIYLLIIY